MGRQAGDVAAAQPELRQARRDIGFAAAIAASVAAAAFAPSAGVMPVTWNQVAPDITSSHFTASGAISLIADWARS